MSAKSLHINTQYSQHLKWIKKINQSCPKTRLGLVQKSSTSNVDNCISHLTYLF